MIPRRAGQAGEWGFGRGFTLMDVIVTVMIVALLLAIMLPVIAKVQSSARRVACSSQVRQIGLCLQLFADDNRGELVSSVFLDTDGRGRGLYRPDRGNLIRLRSGAWDGLGQLHEAGYMDAPSVYYCPANEGDLTFDAFAPLFASKHGTILSNYHYRGPGAEGLDRTYLLPPTRAMTADLLAAHGEANHPSGSNVLRADTSVSWLADPDGTLSAGAPLLSVVSAIENRWALLDASRRVVGDGGGGLDDETDKPVRPRRN